MTTDDALDSGAAAGGTVLIVCAYPDGRLDNAWFRAYKRLRRTIRTKGYNARVALRPIGDLPPDIDVLAVPTALTVELRRTRAEVGETRVVVPERLVGEVEDLLVRRIALGELGYAPPPARTVAVHRGFQAVHERARLAE
jgi:hypothetical protein